MRKKKRGWMNRLLGLTSQEEPRVVAPKAKTGPRYEQWEQVGGRDLRVGYCADDTPYTADEVEFMMALDKYKRDNRRPFPTCSEVLRVLVSLGYRKD